MKRKSFEFEGLKFFERNKEFNDLDGITERYKATQFAFIQKHATDPDDRVALLGMEMHKAYTANELGLFVSTNMEEIRRSLFHSYCLNPETNGRTTLFDNFVKKIIGKEEDILKLLTSMESGVEKKKKIARVKN